MLHWLAHKFVFMKKHVHICLIVSISFTKKKSQTNLQFFLKLFPWMFWNYVTKQKNLHVSTHHERKLHVYNSATRMPLHVHCVLFERSVHPVNFFFPCFLFHFTALESLVYSSCIGGELLTSIGWKESNFSISNYVISNFTDNRYLIMVNLYLTVVLLSSLLVLTVIYGQLWGTGI